MWLQALKASLDPRVFVATGRALWDALGKDLYDFANGLNELDWGGGGNKAAWRTRQHCQLALTILNDFFRSQLTQALNNCIGK